MKTELYTYENNYKIGNKEIYALVGIKETGISAIIEKLSYLLEWFSIGYLFYLNTQYIHSKLFAIFVFICGVVLLQTIGIKRKLSSKVEFIKKVNDILQEVE